MSRSTSCDKKAKFGPYQAEKRANKYNQRSYLCNICGYYHLTSKPNRNIQEIQHVGKLPEQD